MERGEGKGGKREKKRKSGVEDGGEGGEKGERRKGGEEKGHGGGKKRLRRERGVCDCKVYRIKCYKEGSRGGKVAAKGPKGKGREEGTNKG